jgi:Flp pilus assembly protein TadB
MVTSVLWGLLAIIALAVAISLAFVASAYVRRLERQPSLPVSEEISSAPKIVAKLRKSEPMTHDEFEYAQQVVADRSNVMALCIPFTLFSLGCFYVLGSLQHLHGATPSERTFLGIIPMLTSTNLAIQLLRSRRLKGRLKNAPLAS